MLVAVKPQQTRAVVMAMAGRKKSRIRDIKSAMAKYLTTDMQTIIWRAVFSKSLNKIKGCSMISLYCVGTSQFCGHFNNLKKKFNKKVVNNKLLIFNSYEFTKDQTHNVHNITCYPLLVFDEVDSSKGLYCKIQHMMNALTVSFEDAFFKVFYSDRRGWLKQ